MRFKIGFVSIFVFLFVQGLWAADAPILTKQENVDRAVDEMAVQSTESAIQATKKMIQKKKGTREEVVLLWRLADMEWRATKSYFRVSVSKGNKNISEKRYQQLLNDVVTHTTEILTRFPSFSERRPVLVRRGKAYEELKKKDLALKDYYRYVELYGDETTAVGVRLLASDVLVDENKNQSILDILSPVNVNSNLNGMEVPVVQHQAMAYFNLGNYKEALNCTDWLAQYDLKLGKNKEKNGRFDETMSLIALFYGTALEKQIPGYTLEGAYQYFNRYPDSTVFSRVSHEWTLVLRSKEMHGELGQWKSLVLRERSDRFDVFSSLADFYDAVLAWKEYSSFKTVEKDFVSVLKNHPEWVQPLQEEDYFKKFKKTLVEFSDKLFNTLPKKDIRAVDYQIIQEPYLLALSTYLAVTPRLDEVRARIRFRMGEFYLGLKDYEKAQSAFRDVYLAQDYSVPSVELRDLAKTKAISARYDFFKEKGIVPQKLKAIAINNVTGRVPADVEEWIHWVDESALEKTTQKAQILKLVFEANRIIYSYGETRRAYIRLGEFLRLKADLQLLTPSAQLMVDTLIESKLWVDLFKLSKALQTRKDFNQEFRTQLIRVEQDAHFKIAEDLFQAKKYPETIKQALGHIELYPHTRYRGSLDAILGQSYLEEHDDDHASRYLNHLVEVDPTHPAVGVAYTLRIKISEKNYKFQDALNNELNLLALKNEQQKLSPSDLLTLREKILMTAYFLEDQRLNDLLARKDFCGSEDEKLKQDCERLNALGELASAASEDGEKKPTAWEFLDQADHADARLQGVYFAAALMRGSQLPNAGVRKAIDGLNKSFSKLDLQAQFEVLKYLPAAIIRVVERKNDTILRVSQVDHRVEILKETLEKRIKEVKGLESLAGDLATLPVPEVRPDLLLKLSQAYESISAELDHYPIPRLFKAEEASVLKQALVKMSEPIRAKSDALKKQSEGLALELQAGQGKESHIISEVYRQMEIETAKHSLSSGAWIQALREKRRKQIEFFYAMSQQNSKESLNHFDLSEDERVILGYESLVALGLPSYAMQSVKEIAVESSYSDRIKGISILTQAEWAMQSQDWEGALKFWEAFKKIKSEGLTDAESQILSQLEKKNLELHPEKDLTSAARKTANLNSNSQSNEDRGTVR